MKTLPFALLAASLLSPSTILAQSSNYLNTLRQVQFPAINGVNVERDIEVAPADSQPSPLAIDPGGARFDLFTVHRGTLQQYDLCSTFVSTYIPLAKVRVYSKDDTSPIPRTRADQPFWVDVKIEGLLNSLEAQDAAKKVTFYQHVQSYGPKGTGIGIDRTQAILVSQSEIPANVEETMEFTVNTIPGADRAKIRGEQRFSVFSLRDYQSESYDIQPSQLASQFIQVWPVADGSITGIKEGQLIRYSLPKLTLTLNDLYPSSTTYAQVYQGNPQLGVSGKVVPGSSLTIAEAVPMDRVLVIDDYHSVFDADGRWTMELLTVTPFGIDRLATVSFDIDRTIKMNGSFTTIE